MQLLYVILGVAIGVLITAIIAFVVIKRLIETNFGLTKDLNKQLGKIQVDLNKAAKDIKVLKVTFMNGKR